MRREAAASSSSLASSSSASAAAPCSSACSTIPRVGERVDRLRRLGLAHEPGVDERADHRGGGGRARLRAPRRPARRSASRAPRSSAAPRAASASSIAASASALACSSAPTIIITSGVSRPWATRWPPRSRTSSRRRAAQTCSTSTHGGVLAGADLVGEPAQVVEREAGGAGVASRACARRRCAVDRAAAVEAEQVRRRPPLAADRLADELVEVGLGQLAVRAARQQPGVDDADQAAAAQVAQLARDLPVEALGRLEPDDDQLEGAEGRLVGRHDRRLLPPPRAPHVRPRRRRPRAAAAAGARSPSTRRCPPSRRRRGSRPPPSCASGG